MIKLNDRYIFIGALSIFFGCGVLSCSSNQNPEVNNLVIKNNQHSKLLEEHNNYKKECDTQQIAESCFKYARFRDYVEVDFKEAYKYHQKAFKLGYKESGSFIGFLNINHPEIFPDDRVPSIDETIYYLEQAFDVGSVDAIRLLMVIYRSPEHNRIDYKKSEYYTKLAIKENIQYSKSMLANLYINLIKDTSKAKLCIQLFKEELLTERTFLSAQLLSSMYGGGKQRTGIKEDLPRSLAYLYVARDLGYDDSRNKLISDAEILFRPEDIKKAKEVYQEIKDEMDEFAKKNPEKMYQYIIITDKI